MAAQAHRRTEDYRMSNLLRDLLAHQAWADAEQWQAIGALAAARDDGGIRVRLRHVHAVQAYCWWAIGDQASARRPRRLTARRSTRSRHSRG